MTPDLTCYACRELLPWRVAGRLAPGEREAVERHLSNCAACQREAALWEGVATALTDEVNRIPSDVRADSAWLALRDRLPQPSSVTLARRRKVHLVDSDTDSAMGRAAPSITLHEMRRPPRPALALPAAVLLIALIVTLFGVFGAQLRRGKTSTVTGSNTPTPMTCTPSALSAALPANVVIDDISMTSPRAGWAVGWILDGTQTQATAPKTLLLRFQNCQWRSYGDSIPAAQLLSISMSSASDGWAIGATVTDVGVLQANGVTTHQWGRDKPIALHYVDGQWQRVSLPSVTQGISGTVRMTSSGDGWMLIDNGKRHYNPYAATYAYTLLHYQNGAWTPVPLTFDTSGSLILSSIASLTPDDCWIAGYDTGAGDSFAVAHYYQGAWTTWSGPQLGVRYPAFYAIAMSAPNDVWIAGSYPYKDANGDHTGPLALHYDGSRWTRENIGDYTDQMGGGHTLMAIAAQSPADVWAFPHLFGYVGSDYRMAHESGGAWTWTAISGHIVSMDAVVFVSDSEGFAAALTPTQTGMTSMLLHYVGGVWSVIPSN